MSEKYDYEVEKAYIDEKRTDNVHNLREDIEPENSRIEAVRLVTYTIGAIMARVLPTGSTSIFSYSISLNPGPFNIKEHAMIGIAVSTASNNAYAIDILAAMDLFLHYRLSAIGSIILIITTQCLGYGMAGVMRKYLVYPAEMVWWSNLVNVVFYNALHNTDEFKSKRMVRGWSYMTYFWVVASICFVYEFLPQFLAPMFVYMDWICWINPFNRDFWVLFSSYSGVGIFSFALEWNTIGGAALYYPFYSQAAFYGGEILQYWIIFPILWFTNALGIRNFPKPLTPSLYYTNGTSFDVTPFLNPDHSLNNTLYEEGGAAVMTPMYALGFMIGFISLAACVTHVICFNGSDILKTWKSSIREGEEDIHHRMMKVYPEVPQLWYAAFYIVLLALSFVVIEVYSLQLPWWGLIVTVAIGWVMTIPISAMQAITAFSPGLNIITELICGYMLPGKPIANMVFKCYGFMAMYQCQQFLSDLKLGVYMKIPPRSMFVGQLWGTLVGGVFNYFTMILIINSHRAYLDGTSQDPSGLWTGISPQIYWGSALIYGALGPARMFSSDGPYGFVFWGFLIGAIIPIIQWGLSKKFPKVQWSLINVSIVASGMGAFSGGFTTGILFSTITIFIFGVYLFRFHKAWWSKYTFITAAALDTGAAFTGLFIFIFFSGGASSKLSVTAPSWWANFITPEGDNGPYKAIDRCGAASGNWTGGVGIH
ncbi:hypothetical protein BGZ49_004309 [Haplosporangium sp. Z 27]|nr:hypothetical protein BGZ49_004309 [Haplosporangium sp. Z 27]